MIRKGKQIGVAIVAGEVVWKYKLAQTVSILTGELYHIHSNVSYMDHIIKQDLNNNWLSQRATNYLQIVFE